MSRTTEIMKATPRCALLTAALILTAHAGEWRQWRGPSGHGNAEAVTAPRTLSPAENLKWKTALPGRGCSTPIVTGDRIILTAEIDGQDGVIAYDLAGKELWRKSLGDGTEFRHASAGSGCNPSVVSDGGMIFAYFKSGTLAGLDLAGDLKWRKNLQRDYAEDGLKWDLGTSPILAGGHLVVAMMHNQHPSFLLAFDKKDGAEVWKSPRDFDAPAEANDSYTTPFVETVDGVETIVTWGGDHLTGHDAKSGVKLWEHGDFNPKQQKNWRTIASAASTRGVALVPFGRGGFLAGVKLGGEGDTTATRRLWTMKDVGSDSATPAARDGQFHVLNDSGRRRGIVTCVDALSGKVLWETALPKGAAIYYASPILVGNTIYCSRSDGTIFSATITDAGLEDIRTSELGETLVATPVAVDGKLLVRTHEHLWCFE